MMIQLAICDDDEEIVMFQKEVIQNVLRSCKNKYAITTYTHGHNLLYDIIEDGFFFDLLLLDIEMPEVTGMEIAEKIKPFLPNIRIIFITSHVEYAIDAFELSIFRYIPKDDIEKRLPAAINDALKLIELEDGKVYTIQTNNRLEKIPYKEIYYIERDGKNVSLVTTLGISRVRKSLQQVYEELESEYFIFIDRGYIVNIIHIMKVKDGMVVLKNGTTLPISRSHLSDVKEQINTYWGMHV